MPKTQLPLSKRHRRKTKRAMSVRKMWKERKLKALHRVITYQPNLSTSPPIDVSTFPVLKEEIELLAEDVDSAQQDVDEPLIDLKLALEVKEETSPNEGTPHLEDAWGTQADIKEVTAHELTIEKVEEDNTPSGYRVVEISYFTNSIIQMTQAHASVCTAAVPKIVEERWDGYVSTLTMECSMCYRTYTLSTEDPNSKNVINTSAPQGEH